MLRLSGVPSARVETLSVVFWPPPNHTDAYGANGSWMYALPVPVP